MRTGLMWMAGLMLLAGCGREERASTPERATVTFEAQVLHGEWIARTPDGDHPARLRLEAGDRAWSLAGADTLRLGGNGEADLFLIRKLSGTDLQLSRPGQDVIYSYFRQK